MNFNAKVNKTFIIIFQFFVNLNKDFDYAVYLNYVILKQHLMKNSPKYSKNKYLFRISLSNNFEKHVIKKNRCMKLKSEYTLPQLF